MKIYENPDISSWDRILARPGNLQKDRLNQVKKILKQVKEQGDDGLFQLTAQLDGVMLDSFKVRSEEFSEAKKRIEFELQEAIHLASSNIRKFHQAQLPAKEIEVEVMPGVRCWQRAIPIEKVGLYIPGGTAPLFSTVLMLAIPASLAGCREIILCTPPDKNGMVHPAILYAAQLSGISNVFKIGGAQAIAAMAYGTQTIPKVNKIFGPGNAFVTAAKELVQTEGIAIDLPAGPSEVMVVADETAYPDFVAADLLSQAEHGPDSQVVLVTTSESLLQQVQEALKKQLRFLPRRNLAGKALSSSIALRVPDLDTAVKAVNEYGPEHLILALQNPKEFSDKVQNAGSVFLGHFTPESVGDYASGTNHTLPTNGYARAYSGVNMDSFFKKITYQELSPEGLKKIGKTVEIMAAAESLEAHKNAVSIRLNTLNQIT